jgi:AcrR family transcriptional regulator
MSNSSERRYHHGDLRREILETALAMLQEQKGWQFTLREVARRAGVSHGAPYKHFPDKASLLAEIAMIGFDRLREAVTDARTDAPRNLYEEIAPMARAYVSFGIDNPALYRLMFSADEGQAVGIHLSERALVVFDMFRLTLRRGQEAGVIRKRPIEGQAATGWGLMHGLTMLAIDGLLLPEKVGHDPLNAALTTLLEGLETERVNDGTLKPPGA